MIEITFSGLTRVCIKPLLPSLVIEYAGYSISQFVRFKPTQSAVLAVAYAILLPTAWG